MMGDACREWRGSLAASALGRIDAAEAIALRAHLDGCQLCRSELEELSAVAHALPLADAARLGDDAPEPPADLVVHVVDRVERQRDQRRRGRMWRALAIAAAVLVVLGVSVGVIATRSGGSSSATVVQFSPTHEGSGSARLVAHDEGTEVHLAADGLDDGDWYWLWLTGPDGHRVGAGTFRGTGNDVHVTLTAALPLDEAERIWVTDDADKVVLDAHIQPA
jgi:hypothetical protein